MRKHLNSLTVPCVLYSPKYEKYAYYGQLDQLWLVDEDNTEAGVVGWWGGCVWSDGCRGLWD